ncbi:MAG: FCD domain-containing protein [Streptosporangiaceae bacterium]
MREVLEGLATRLAVENTGRRLVDRLAEVMAEHEDAVDARDHARHVEADTRFHRLIRHAGANPEVVRLLDDIQTRVRLAMRTTAVTGGPRRALEDHRAIFAVIRSADPTVAEREARRHVARLRGVLLARAAAAETSAAAVPGAQR